MSGSADARLRLPPNVRVFVRDWLSANNVLLKGSDGHVLIDTGYATHAPLTLALLASPDGIGQAPLALVVNTHGHSDHVGGNAALVQKYGCPVAFPANEADAVARWDDKALLYDYADQRVTRFRVDRRIAPASLQVWGGLEWRAIAAPGHDMGALVFHNALHRLLISGDALWKDGFGFVMPDSGSGDIYLHASALRRSGVQAVEPDQRIRYSTRQGNKGVEVDRVEII